MSKVSIIIPTKNRVELLIVTLNNILAQSYSDLEVVVVDDASTDGTIAILSERYTGKVKVVKNEGKGPGAGRNTGIKHSTGEYIKFFDSDDLMTRNLIEEQVRILKVTGEPAVYSPYVHFYENEQGEIIQKDVILQYKPIPSSSSLRSCMVKGFFSIIPGFLFKREFITEQVGNWREDITAYEDWDYLWRIAGFIKNPAHTNKAAVFYRIHGNQITGALLKDEEREVDKVHCLSKLLNEYRDQLSYIDLCIFKARLWESLTYLKSHIRNEIELNCSHPVNRLTLIVLKGERKYNRYRTRSQWQIMHGITKSKEIFSHYLSLLSDDRI